ncbi:oxoglutarate malate translocator protein, putative [Ichthyophthirius multifiliis]|uniref:Oxoglutarate malate translocator protein, putative n=1 Tax=Ichthyophthirius multifiliis TaxID=5932 RepID=G0QZ30_ICHMU|nr:oxoglutarate malate translocator protein, putative [Ichthyophthirius multifiliis]EGR29516.1 oxoglutarate malate translocator protein, putative [Ichthyophthirius multifiliis]|eukprot:XP_004030752.1 oxoglutarate malate translocator protein, putative [Ichthyophthirius multifiliis]
MFFELEDLQRRHSQYWDIYNVQGWVRRKDSTFLNNAYRGAVVGTVSQLIQENITALIDNCRLLANKYEKPKNISEAGVFLKEVFKLKNYQKSVVNRSMYALCSGTFDWGARLAAFRWVNNGWQRPFAGFEYNFIRKIPGSIFAALLTAPIGIPFEMARYAYYADKTFPKELQRGYSNYLSALFRIPLEEGPYYLFKNTSPLFLRNFFQTYTLLYTYDFLQDKMSFIWRVGEQSELVWKGVIASLSTLFACLTSYPFMVAREMVDFWPKQNGVCPWNGNYRKASVWIYYHELSSNIFAGMFSNYFFKVAPSMFISLMLADKFGIFEYTVVDMFSGAGNNSWEDTFV